MDQQNNIVNQTTQGLTEEMTQTLLKRVFGRVVHVLTEEDMQAIDKLDKEDSTGNSVKYFLLTKLPHMDSLVTEELQKLKDELYKPLDNV